MSSGNRSLGNRFIQVLAQWITFIFYRLEMIGEDIPAGPVLLVMNHPNALLDPAILRAGTRRPVRFLAKSPLFTHSPLGLLIRYSGAIPVYRPGDEGVDVTKNVSMFAAVQQALVRGEAVGIFPEGRSHSSGHLERLRTGAARITLEAFRERIPVLLVPVGINYERKTIFRSRVTVLFGVPFSAEDLLEIYRIDPDQAVRLLTDRISERLRSLMVEAEPNLDAALVERVDRLLTSARGLPDTPRERIERKQTIARGIERLRARNPVLYERLWFKMRVYDQRLKRFGFRDRILDNSVPGSTLGGFLLREAGYGLLLAPLCLGGFLLFAVPYYAVALFITLKKPSPDAVATYKALGGGVFHLIWFGLLVGWAGYIGGWVEGVLVFFMVPLIGILSLFAIERETESISTLRAYWTGRRLGRETRYRFLKRRNDLADLLEEAYRWMQADNHHSGM